MAVFFFVIGLEVKREIALGELRELRRAALPLAAAMGGMIVPAGIVLLSWLSLKLGLTRLPEGVSWRHMAGGGFLAGIGFTMALFITGLAFADETLLRSAKVGVLVGSLVSASIGMAILSTAAPPAK